MKKNYIVTIFLTLYVFTASYLSSAEVSNWYYYDSLQDNKNKFFLYLDKKKKNFKIIGPKSWGSSSSDIVLNIEETKVDDSYSKLQEYYKSLKLDTKYSDYLNSKFHEIAYSTTGRCRVVYLGDNTTRDSKNTAGGVQRFIAEFNGIKSKLSSGKVDDEIIVLKGADDEKYVLGVIYDQLKNVKNFSISKTDGLFRGVRVVSSGDTYQLIDDNDDLLVAVTVENAKNNSYIMTAYTPKINSLGFENFESSIVLLNYNKKEKKWTNKKLFNFNKNLEIENKVLKILDSGHRPVIKDEKNESYYETLTNEEINKVFDQFFENDKAIYPFDNEVLEKSYEYFDRCVFTQNIKNKYIEKELSKGDIEKICLRKVLLQASSNQLIVKGVNGAKLDDYFNELSKDKILSKSKIRIINDKELLKLEKSNFKKSISNSIAKTGHVISEIKVIEILNKNEELKDLLPEDNRESYLKMVSRDLIDSVYQSCMNTNDDEKMCLDLVKQYSIATVFKLKFLEKVRKQIIDDNERKSIEKKILESYGKCLLGKNDNVLSKAMMGRDISAEMTNCMQAVLLSFYELKSVIFPKLRKNLESVSILSPLANKFGKDSYYSLEEDTSVLDTERALKIALANSLKLRRRKGRLDFDKAFSYLPTFHSFSTPLGLITNIDRIESKYEEYFLNRSAKGLVYKQVKRIAEEFLPKDEITDQLFKDRIGILISYSKELSSIKSEKDITNFINEKAPLIYSQILEILKLRIVLFRTQMYVAMAKQNNKDIVIDEKAVYQSVEKNFIQGFNKNSIKKVDKDFSAFLTERFTSRRSKEAKAGEELDLVKYHIEARDIYKTIKLNYEVAELDLSYKRMQANPDTKIHFSGKEFKEMYIDRFIREVKDENIINILKEKKPLRLAIGDVKKKLFRDLIKEANKRIVRNLIFTLIPPNTDTFKLIFENIDKSLDNCFDEKVSMDIEYPTDMSTYSSPCTIIAMQDIVRNNGTRIMNLYNEFLGDERTSIASKADACFDKANTNFIFPSYLNSTGYEKKKDSELTNEELFFRKHISSRKSYDLFLKKLNQDLSVENPEYNSIVKTFYSKKNSLDPESFKKMNLFKNIVLENVNNRFIKDRPAPQVPSGPKTSKWTPNKEYLNNVKFAYFTCYEKLSLNVASKVKKQLIRLHPDLEITKGVDKLLSSVVSKDFIYSLSEMRVENSKSATAPIFRVKLSNTNREIKRKADQYREITPGELIKIYSSIAEFTKYAHSYNKVDAQDSLSTFISMVINEAKAPKDSMDTIDLNYNERPIFTSESLNGLFDGSGFSDLIAKSYLTNVLKNKLGHRKGCSNTKEEFKKYKDSLEKYNKFSFPVEVLDTLFPHPKGTKVGSWVYQTEKYIKKFVNKDKNNIKKLLRESIIDDKQCIRGNTVNSKKDKNEFFECLANEGTLLDKMNPFALNGVDEQFPKPTFGNLPKITNNSYLNRALRKYMSAKFGIHSGLNVHKGNLSKEFKEVYDHLKVKMPSEESYTLGQAKSNIEYYFRNILLKERFKGDFNQGPRNMTNPEFGLMIDDWFKKIDLGLEVSIREYIKFAGSVEHYNFTIDEEHPVFVEILQKMKNEKPAKNYNDLSKEEVVGGIFTGIYNDGVQNLDQLISSAFYFAARTFGGKVEKNTYKEGIYKEYAYIKNKHYKIKRDLENKILKHNFFISNDPELERKFKAGKLSEIPKEKAEKMIEDYVDGDGFFEWDVDYTLSEKKNLLGIGSQFCLVTAQLVDNIRFEDVAGVSASEEIKKSYNEIKEKYIIPMMIGDMSPSEFKKGSDEIDEFLIKAIKNHSAKDGILTKYTGVLAQQFLNALDREENLFTKTYFVAHDDTIGNGGEYMWDANMVDKENNPLGIYYTKKSNEDGDGVGRLMNIVADRIISPKIRGDKISKKEYNKTIEMIEDQIKIIQEMYDDEH